MSLNTFTDNIIVLAVENCLIRKIPSVFDPALVLKMDDERLSLLAGETERTQNEREYLTEDLEILTRGLAECKRYRSKEMPGMLWSN
jgi:hypothetical protein